MAQQLLEKRLIVLQLALTNDGYICHFAFLFKQYLLFFTLFLGGSLRCMKSWLYLEGLDYQRVKLSFIWMSFFIGYIKCEIYQVAQSGKNPQRCFFHQRRMVVLLSRMPMSPSAVAALAGILQITFKNRGMMGGGVGWFFFCGLLSAIIKMCLSRFTLFHFTFELDVETVKLSCHTLILKS